MQPAPILPSPNLSHILAIIYDVDDCLALGTNDDILEEWLLIFAEDLNLTVEEARLLNTTYLKTSGCSATAFAEAHGKPLSWVNEVYTRSAPLSGARFAARQPYGLLATTTEALHKAKVIQMILTLGHKLHADAVIAHLGMNPFIPHHLRQYRVNKHLEETYRRALHVIDLPPENILMVEDSPRNLAAAAALGIQTALVGPRDPGPYATSIHYLFPTVQSLQQARLAA